MKQQTPPATSNGCLLVAAEKPVLSFIIPVMNEQESLEELFVRIAQQARAHAQWWEIIFIDDGSTDSSWQIIKRIAQANPKLVQALRFRSNQGKAAALHAGYEQARGEYVFTLDADLQDDPAEIPRFLAKLAEGYDIVSGWKKTRHDPWHKVLPSRVFNRMLSALSGVCLHDHNCGFKLYRREVVKSLPMYGEMHRMVPSLASIEGFRTAEIPVQHHPRKFGSSKYGVKRFLRGFMDMWTVCFLKNYRERPLHLFGGIAVASVIGGTLLWGASWFLPASSPAVALGTALPISIALAILLGGLGLLTELQVSHNLATPRRLPVGERIGCEPDECADTPHAARRVISKRSNTALVLEDDKPLCMLVTKFLRKAGWTVQVAGSVTEALKFADTNLEVAFIDINLPDGDGIAFLSRLTDIAPRVKPIILSSKTDINVGVQAMKAGAFDYLTKPVRPNAVISAARRALGSAAPVARQPQVGDDMAALSA